MNNENVEKMYENESLKFAAQACKIRMNRLSMSKQITLKSRPFYIKT